MLLSAKTRLISLSACSSLPAARHASPRSLRIAPVSALPADSSAPARAVRRSRSAALYLPSISALRPSAHASFHPEFVGLEPAGLDGKPCGFTFDSDLELEGSDLVSERCDLEPDRLGPELKRRESPNFAPSVSNLKINKASLETTMGRILSQPRSAGALGAAGSGLNVPCFGITARLIPVLIRILLPILAGAVLRLRWDRPQPGQ